MTRSARIGIGLVALLGGFVFFLLTVGSLGEPQPDVARRSVASVLEGSAPASRFGDEELLIHGFYAELVVECREPSAVEPAGPVAWLERTCPLRVLMPYQPAETVTQQELEAYGLPLAAPNGQPFPARARPDGPNLRLQELVYTGHFDDTAAEQCAAERADRCRNTFVVSDYDGYLR